VVGQDRVAEADAGGRDEQGGGRAHWREARGFGTARVPVIWGALLLDFNRSE
jgi:hypothetical protein